MTINTIFFLSLNLAIYTICSRLVISQTLPTYSSRRGQWHLLHSSIGISAMHMQVLHDNKVIMFDRTDFGSSNISLPGGRCRYDPSDLVSRIDCTAHSILYDIGSNTFRPLTVQTDTWCSSGSVLPNGTLIQTGGYNDGDHVVRVFKPCEEDYCDWIELPNYLSQRRWYATNQLLPDGRIIILGGRRQFNYEFYPRENNNKRRTFRLDFLRQTRDSDENNLYPFLHLLPDGNLFIFANTRSILFNYNLNRVVKEFPSIPGGEPRNYPSSGSSVLLPLMDENRADTTEAEIMICGGAPNGAHLLARQGNFVQAISSCGRLKVTDQNPTWIMEDMPIPRVMGDMVILPTGDILIINGAGFGTAGWECGQDPVQNPVIYHPSAQPDRRFTVMAASPRRRLYHSTAVLVPDGRVLVGGSNPHIFYNFTGVEYRTDLSLEAFSPPYLRVEYGPVRPKNVVVGNEILRYGQAFWVTFTVPRYLNVDVLSVRIVAPSFTTHSFGMNQRMVVMKLVGISTVTQFTYNVSVIGPSTVQIAPSGYYMLFVVHGNVPSAGTWIKLQ
ncbi:hypothetical protein FEM48_Zijuj02G0157900 [Ziziphus jujuba var. spinosa]|uniref:Aldehyde oxidase GLOX-like n=1 Tax=Ziziphus jujuba var. spinosa TaxID=714518 RepID=A0A978VWJ9_ZIZJJ|nr:hypothetical protein FEM48_Zijuj02G0157900 [Ziziphus jujuba var. spinosa]